MIPLFVNPAARLGGAVGDAAGGDPRFILIQVAPDKLEQAIRDRIAAGAARVAVAGGDGTIATAAGAVRDAGVPLGIIPAGTRNHFARTVGVPLDMVHALDVAAGDSFTTADVGELNGRVFLNTSSVGTYVTLIRRRERLRPYLRYHLAGLLSAVSLLGGIPDFSLEIEVAGEEPQAFRTPLVFIGVGERDLSVRTFGERVPDGPSALHALVVKGRGRARLLALALSAAAHGIRGLHRRPHIDAIFVEQCTIHLSRPSTSIALDGDIYRMSSPLHYSIRRNAVTVLAPPGPAST